MVVNFDSHHINVLSRTFEGLNIDILQTLLSRANRPQLEPGDYLFRQGSHENSLYIVLSGRLRAVMEDPSGIHILGDIGEGEPAGEMAMFTNEPRMASVLAIRKTTVLEISKEDYYSIIAQNPSFASTLTSVLIKRINRNSLERSRSGAPKNIALINLQPENDLSPWTEDIERTLRISGISTQVFSEGALPEDQYKTIFDTLEQHNGLNVLVCSQAYPEWSRQCVIYADLIIVATKFSATHELYDIEKSLNLYAQNITNRKLYIVFLHDENAQLPTHTNRWLAKRKVDLHIHLRQHKQTDVRRFCRIISNQAVGVVLGGGGAKGFAHVGAVKELMEAGVEIDFIGGTSAGALHGITMAFCDLDFERISQVCESGVKRKLTSNDYTLPLLSFMSGRKVDRFISKLFGKHDMEDLWINAYTVSSNFSHSGASVHEYGPIKQKVMASIAIPGIFPPVVINNELHVDGGVVDNLPIEPMYRFPLKHIIAISLSGQLKLEVDYQELPSARRLIWQRMLGKKQDNIPGIGTLIVESLTLNSRQRQDAFKSKASLYIELDLKDVGFLDDKRWRDTMVKGALQVRQFINNLPETKKFWIKGRRQKASDQLEAF